MVVKLTIALCVAESWVSDMRVVKAIAVAGSKSSWASLYELKIWLEDYDLSTKGRHDYISYDALLNVSGGKKGWNFKRVNDFLSTEDGLRWVNDVLSKREK